MLSMEKFQELSTQIGEALGYEVSFDPDKSYTTSFAYLEKEDQKITLINGQYGNKDRIVIRGDYPRPKDGQYHGGNTLSITVTENKTATAIIKDIRRRLLPDYMEGLVTVLDSNAKRNSELKTAKDSIAMVAAALETEPISHSGQPHEAYIYSRDTSMGGIEARYRYNGEFDIKLNFPLSKVLDLIGFLKNPTLTTICVSNADVEAYCERMGYSNGEADHLIANLDSLTDDVVAYVQETEWRRLFEEACDGYVTGYRMAQKKTYGELWDEHSPEEEAVNV